MDLFAQKPKVLPVEVLAVGTGPGYMICQAVKSLLADNWEATDGKERYFSRPSSQRMCFLELITLGEKNFVTQESSRAEKHLRRVDS